MSRIMRATALMSMVIVALLPMRAMAIDLSRLYGHLGPPPQKRSGGKS